MFIQRFFHAKHVSVKTASKIRMDFRRGLQKNDADLLHFSGANPGLRWLMRIPHQSSYMSLFFQWRTFHLNE